MPFKIQLLFVVVVVVINHIEALGKHLELSLKYRNHFSGNVYGSAQ